MPRIRTIKPEFWIDDRLAVIPPWSRLFYIGLWNFCDDVGVFEWKPNQLKVQILPYDQEVDINKCLNDLMSIQCLLKFTHEGKEYGYIKNFSKHQKFDPRYKKEILNGFDLTKINHHTVDTLGTHSDHSREGEREGEREGDNVISQKSPEPKPTRFSDFLEKLNALNIFSTPKISSDTARTKYNTRRKTFTDDQLLSAFSNLKNEHDQWQLKNNGFRPLSWWLEKDDRIEQMLNIHLKSQKKSFTRYFNPQIDGEPNN